MHQASTITQPLPNLGRVGLESERKVANKCSAYVGTLFLSCSMSVQCDMFILRTCFSTPASVFISCTGPKQKINVKHYTVHLLGTTLISQQLVYVVYQYDYGGISSIHSSDTKLVTFTSLCSRPSMQVHDFQYFFLSSLRCGYVEQCYFVNVAKTQHQAQNFPAVN